MDMKTLKWIVIFIILILIGGWFYGYEKIISQINPDYLCKDLDLKQVLYEKDVRNKGIYISICYKSYDDKGTIILELYSLSSDKSRVDVFRYILQAAEQLKDKQFDKVEFAFTGESKFYILGDYFEKLGEEYGWQNVIYTQRTFPQNLKNMDGTDAYPTWSGGLLGVMKQQTENNIDFHNKWYWNEIEKKYNE